MRIYLTDISPLSDNGVFQKYYLQCTGMRRAKIDALKNADDRMRSLGAGILLKRALAEHGIYEPDFSVTNDRKPYISNVNIHFNLSHSGKYVAVAISDTDVGIDIEVPRTVDLKLSERYFTATECDAISSAEDKATELMRIWTRKEALSKAIGSGLSTQLLSVCTLDTVIELNSEKFTVNTLKTVEFVLSVAVRGTADFDVTKHEEVFL